MLEKIIIRKLTSMGKNEMPMHEFKAQLTRTRITSKDAKYIARELDSMNIIHINRINGRVKLNPRRKI